MKLPAYLLIITFAAALVVACTVQDRRRPVQRPFYPILRISAFPRIESGITLPPA